jgi:CubicO group peptidase (beta-lactamase class C family)
MHRLQRLASVAIPAALTLMASSLAQAQAVTADTPEKTVSGATFTLPKAWSLAGKPGVMVANAPEGDARIAIVDVESAADAKDAAAKAWALYAPERVHPFKLATPAPARSGWDERVRIDYETSANEKLDLSAGVQRKDKHWTVMLVDSSTATAEKRGAAMGLIGRSLRPAGYSRESFAGKTAHPLDAARIEAMRSFVETSIKALGVPGGSFALIDHGKLVYEGGVGVRELGKPAKVDAHTLFMVASNTKGMSTLLLARQVDAGKVGWDQPVTEVYPTFRLGSDATTKKVLIRHLVCACTGLPRKDLDWIFATTPDTPASTTFTQLAATEPTSGFGEVFQYNNLMASAAGYIAGHLVYPKLEIGAAYDKAMQTEVFDPLGMHETTFSTKKALLVDHASPHDLDIDARPALGDNAFNDSVMPYRPAGGAWSSAHDMIKYVQDEITQGVLPDGKRLVSTKNLLQRRLPNVPVGEDQFYGMGLETDATWGVTVVHHGGSMAGFKTDIMLVPDAQVGAVILTNSDEGQLLLRPFMRRLLEVMYDGKPEAAGDVAAAAKRVQAEYAAERPRLTVPPAAGPAGKLAAHYTNADLGPLTVKKAGAGVRFEFPEWGTDVASRKNDDGSLSFVSITPTLIGFEFVAGEKDGKRTLTTRDGQHEYVYVEAAATGRPHKTR